MDYYKNVSTFQAKSVKEWRNWLKKNHSTEKSIWLIIYKKKSRKPSVNYNEAVDHALCFGWIDSIPNSRDADSYYQFFAKRNPKSNWSKLNKEKIAKLLEMGLMQPSALQMVTEAKRNGTWNALDEVEKLTLPKDLKAMFFENKKAFKNWKGFPPSSKRGILEWILNAKKPETRNKRIKETILLAEKDLRANHYRQKNK